MHMYQGKGRWGFNAEMLALTWLVLYCKYQNEIRSVHESTNQVSQTNTPLWCLSRLPTRKHTIALTLILASFISIQFKLSNNQAKLSKQSITADTSIRIVFLTLQGCTTFTHMIISYRLCTRHHSRVPAMMITTTSTS